MKILRKAGVIFLAALMVPMAAFAGCSKGDDWEDPTKTQIYVGMIDGGFGTSWFEPVAAEFEEMYKDVSFQEGRTGVQIKLDPSSTAYMTDNLINNIENIKQELIFTESGFDFYYDFINQGKILNITDVVTEPLTEFGESGTIEEKLPQSFIDYYKTDRKYYALPNNEATVGIVYNVDLWESNNLYLAKEADNGNNGFVLGPDDERSTGPDGEYGTYDDGLPATYADFFKVCDVLKNTYSIDPILWYYPYVSTMLSCMHADYEGVDAFMDNFDFSAKAAKLVDDVTRVVDPETGYISYEYTTKEVNLTQENGYEVFRQAGRLHALEFLENILALGYASSRNFDESYTHLTMQEQFLYGGVSKNVKQAAMLVEGSWWENEATGVFNDMARDYTNEYSKENRKFGFMPFPKPTMEEVESKQGYTMLQTNRTMVLINANTPEWKVDLVKKLLAFVNTDDQIMRYTTETNTTRPVKYPEDADLSNMTYFGKELLNVHNNAQTVFPLSRNELFTRNTGAFALGGQSFYTEIDNMEYNMPSKDMNSEKFTALQWFDGLYKYRTEQWPSYLNKLS